MLNKFERRRGGLFFGESKRFAMAEMAWMVMGVNIKNFSPN